MGDESMVRNVAYQAEAIWPQERHLFDRYRLSGAIDILDLGCGSGEITRRLAGHYPQASLLGIDILDDILDIARRTSTPHADRIRYRQGDAFSLPLADQSMDLVTCRHVSQAVPDFPLVLEEITRVLRPGGWLHLLSEDYSMLQFPVANVEGAFDPDLFWIQNGIAFLRNVGCDGRIGRHSPALLQAAGYQDVAMDYVCVDTLRVSRTTFASIIRSWRDGFSESLAVASRRDSAAVRADFDTMIAAIETPPNYVVWQVPVVSARKP
jgi:SAM-dependent methyltransferase